MPYQLAALHLLAAAKKSTGSIAPLLLLVGVAILGYFFFLKPQQRKAAAARANVGTGYEVGDEVQTIGGVVGTILEIHGDRYTLLTGNVGGDGNLAGAQPTRIVFVRQAIARKLEPVVDVEDEPVEIDDAYDDDVEGHEHEEGVMEHDHDEETEDT